MKWWKYVGHQWKISTDQQDIFYWENICKNRHTGCLVCWNLFKAMNDTNNKVNKKKNRIPNYCFTWNLHVRVLSFPQLKKIMQVLVNRSVCKNNKQQFAHLPVDLVFFIDFLFISTKFNFKLFFYILSSFFLVFQGLLPLFGDGGSDGCFPFQHQQPEKKKTTEKQNGGTFFNEALPTLLFVFRAVGGGDDSRRVCSLSKHDHFSWLTVWFVFTLC